MLLSFVIGTYLLCAALAAPVPDGSSETITLGQEFSTQVQQIPGGRVVYQGNGQPGQPGQRVVVHRTVQTVQNGQPGQTIVRRISQNGQPGQQGQPGQTIVRRITQNGQPGQQGQPGQPQVIVHRYTQTGQPGQQGQPGQPQIRYIQNGRPGQPGQGQPGQPGQPGVQVITVVEQNEIRNNLNQLPNVQINSPPNEPESATLPGNVLYQFLQDQGVPLPNEPKNPNIKNSEDPVTIYTDQLFNIMGDKPRYGNMPPQQVINILKNRPNSPSSPQPQPPTSPVKQSRPPLTEEEKTVIVEKLSSNPDVNIVRRPKPKGDTVTLPAKDLYYFLQEQGFPLPDDMSQVPGFRDNEADRLITIYLDQLYYIIEKMDILSNMPPILIINILSSNPYGVAEGPNNEPGAGGAPGEPGSVNVEIDKTSTEINGGNSYLANTGVNRRTECDRGLVDETATALKSTLNGGLNGLASAITGITGTGSDSGILGLVGGALGAVELGKTALLTNAISGVDFAIQDAACGLGNIANELASALDNGDILGGVGKIGQELVGGVGNIAEDLVSQAGAGVGEAAGQIFGYLQGD